MEEKEKITLQLFFDSISTDISDFERYMKNTVEVSKKDFEIFLNNLNSKIQETRKEIEE